MSDTATAARREVHLGQLALDQADWLGAAQRFLAALELNPRDAMAWYGQGLVMRQLGQDAPAREAFDRAAALDPTLIPARRSPDRTVPTRAAPVLPWVLPPRPPRTSRIGTLAGMWDRLATQTDPALAFAHPTDELQTVSGVALAHRARSWAARLALDPDPVVPIFGRTHPETIAAYLGATLVGKTPVFVAFPSNKLHRDHWAELLAAHLQHFGTDRFVALDVDRDLVLRPLGPADVGDETLGPVPQRDPDDPLFLQCSSGTTGRQKVVQITTRQLEHQLSAYAEALAVDPGTDRVASWLPLYHDMGLIATLWLPLICDLPVVFLDPFEWAAAPGSLYQTIAASRATLVWQPNFALGLACRAPLLADLSSVRSFVSCAEPISATTTARFCQTLGVRPEQVSHCYALAENVFCATQTPLGRGPDFVAFDAAALDTGAVVAGGDRLLASVGKPIRGVEVKIDADGPDRVGEIWLSGPCTITAYRGGSPPRRDGWFPTGDLGFVHQGELFVTGRSKDLIVHQGRNLHPHDLEDVLFEDEGVHPGRGVVLGDYDEEAGTELVRVLFEPSGDPAGVADRVTRTLEGRFAVRPRVHPVPRGWLRKTSSGKIARGANRDRFWAQRRRSVHILGDSHVRIWWRSPQEDHHARVHGHWLGVLWADSWPARVGPIEDLCRRIGPDDVLVIAAGEPECRTIFGGADRPSDRIDASVAGYRALFEHILRVRPGGPLAYMTGIPTRTHEVPQLRDDWRIVGDLSTRLEHQRRFYGRMADLCAELELPFIDACSPLQDPEGRVLEDRLHDGVHLHPKHRPELLWWMTRALGVIDDAAAPPAPARPWDGTRAHFDALCGAELDRLGCAGRRTALVAAGHLGSMQLIALIGFLERSFGADLVLHRLVRSDFDDLDAIWRIVAASVAIG